MSIAAKLVLLLACLVAGFAAGVKWHAGVDAQKEVARLELERKGAEQTRAAERRQSVDVIGAINDAKKREQLARAAAAGADDAAERLRDDLADLQKRLPGASLNACRNYAATLATVLGACQKEYRALGGDAAGHANDSLMYQQAWPKPSQP